MSLGCRGWGRLCSTACSHRAVLAAEGWALWTHCRVHGQDVARATPQGTQPQSSTAEMLFLFDFLAFRLGNCGMLWKSAKVLIRQRISKRGKKGWQAGTRDKMANL